LLLDLPATAALGKDGWTAGVGLMQRTNPEQWNNINAALLRSEAAGVELKICIEAAKKSGKERCSVIMKPQTPPQ
jgi:sulfur relay (sulfurtransferase) complex TusBCD TusD component (DsrE family)